MNTPCSQYDFLDSEHHWSAFLTSLGGHMLFDQRGLPKAMVNHIECLPPEHDNPAEALTAGQTWGIDVKIRLVSQHRKKKHRAYLQFKLPTYTCRETLIVRGEEYLPWESRRELDQKMSNRIQRWLENHRNSLVSEVVNQGSRWNGNGYRHGITDIIREILNHAIERAGRPGRNRLAHQLRLQKYRSESTLIRIEEQTAELLFHALPITSRFAGLPPWVSAKLDKPLYSTWNQTWASAEDGLPTVMVETATEPGLSPGSILLARSTLAKLKTPRNESNRNLLSHSQTSIPKIGDPLALIDINGVASEVRLAGVHNNGSSDVIAHPLDLEQTRKKGTSIVRLAEHRNPHARARDIPNSVLACDALAHQILESNEPTLTLNEWGPRWQVLEPWMSISRARRLQSLLAPYGLAMERQNTRHQLVNMSPADVTAVAEPMKGFPTNGARTQTKSLVDRLPAYKPELFHGKRAYLNVRYSRYRGNQYRNRNSGVLSLPVTGMLVGGNRQKPTALASALNALTRIIESEFRPWSAHALTRRQDQALSRVYDELSKELEQLFALDEALPEGGWCPVIGHPGVARGEAQLSPDLMDALNADGMFQRPEMQHVLLVGDRARLFRASPGEGKSCVRLHPIDVQQMGPEVFSMIPRTAEAIQEAKTLQHIQSGDWEDCWLHPFIGKSASEIPDLLERAFEENHSSTFHHPCSRRVLGWLGPRQTEVRA